MNKICNWKEDENGNWTTDCGEAFYLDTGSPEDNKFVFCPFCGGELDTHVHMSEQDHADERGDREYQNWKDEQP